MKVLVITGDRNFKLGNPRFDLQRSHIDELVSIFWGKGSLLPRMPKNNFDIVTVQDPFWRGFFAWFCARRLRARFNVQVHTDLSAQSFFRRILAQFILRRADSIRVVSEKIKNQVEAFGVRAPIHILHIFIDLPKFRNIIRHLHTRPRILWLGRFEKEKDPLAAISVLEKVRETGIDAELVMLGEGTMTQEVAKHASHKPIMDILRPGWSDVITYLGTAHVVLCTSLYEGWGASIVEAHEAGVPVVTPDVGVAKKLQEAGGAIVKIVPHEKLAEAVVDVLNSTTADLKNEPKPWLVENPKEWAQRWKESL